MSIQDDALLLTYITVPEREVALKLASEMVRLKLAAGANVTGPVHSFYRWRGELCEADEWQIFVQTRAGVFQDLKMWLLSEHPHHVPCIISANIVCGNDEFLAWIRGNTGGKTRCM